MSNGKLKTIDAIPAYMRFDTAPKKVARVSKPAPTAAPTPEPTTESTVVAATSKPSTPIETARPVSPPSATVTATTQSPPITDEKEPQVEVSPPPSDPTPFEEPQQRKAQTARKRSELERVQRERQEFVASRGGRELDPISTEDDQAEIDQASGMFNLGLPDKVSRGVTFAGKGLTPAKIDVGIARIEGMSVPQKNKVDKLDLEIGDRQKDLDIMDEIQAMPPLLMSLRFHGKEGEEPLTQGQKIMIDSFIEKDEGGINRFNRNKFNEVYNYLTNEVKEKTTEKTALNKSLQLKASQIGRLKEQKAALQGG